MTNIVVNVFQSKSLREEIWAQEEGGRSLESRTVWNAPKTYSFRRISVSHTKAHLSKPFKTV